jgi:2-isopropylmalate synthase
MWEIFAAEYLFPDGGRFTLKRFNSSSDDGVERVTATITIDGVPREISGIGNGPIDAFCSALSGTELDLGGASIRVHDYAEHALTTGQGAEAAAYLELEIGERVLWGVGISESIVAASLRAVVSGMNRVARALVR